MDHDCCMTGSTAMKIWCRMINVKRVYCDGWSMDHWFFIFCTWTAHWTRHHRGQPGWPPSHPVHPDLFNNCISWHKFAPCSAHYATIIAVLLWLQLLAALKLLIRQLAAVLQLFAKDKVLWERNDWLNGMISFDVWKSAWLLPSGCTLPLIHLSESWITGLDILLACQLIQPLLSLKFFLALALGRGIVLAWGCYLTEVQPSFGLVRVYQMLYC